MSGTDDNVAVIGDWTPRNPSTQAFLSDFLGDDLLSENGNAGPLQEQKLCVDSMDKHDDDIELEASSVTVAESDPFRIPKPGLRVGLTERIAARAGFNAPKLNTTRIRSNNLGSSSSDVRSPCIALSPGLSPTAFLDSPVFLLNSLAQPSPTTGKFPLGQCTNTSSVPVSEPIDKDKDLSFADVDTKPFAFRPHLESSPYFSTTANKNDSIDPQEPWPSIEVSVQPEFPNQDGSSDATGVCSQNQHDVQLLPDFSEPADRRDLPSDFTFNAKASDSALGNENSPPPADQLEGEDQKGEFSSVGVGQPAEDGYNWRKYGQKQVKGSEFPRSYYKCTHPNCQVKKKVERSPEGHITEIIYKGNHNHPKPPLNRRAAVTSSNPFVEMQIDGSENLGLQPSTEGRSMWASTQNGTAGPDWRNDGMDASSSVPVTAEFCDPSTSVHTQDVPRFESSDAIDVSPALSNDEDDDGATHRSANLGGDGDEDESESKRRKLDASVMDMSAASRAVREPRVVVQTTSEVDILDDGYRWRKYGQKVVKGNPNPRSYYKCTSAGCTVRKHVERASHDLKSVITTYEGKHNHEVPAARNSSHSSSGATSTTTNLASQSHSIQRRSDPCRVQESFTRFDTPPALGAFGLQGREQLGPPAGFTFGLSQPGLINLTMAGLGPAGPVKMLPQMHPYLGQRPLGDSGFVVPKGEPQEEPMTESSLSNPNGASVYQQIMSRLPLGP